jgi:hypothetical protein
MLLAEESTQIGGLLTRETPRRMENFAHTGIARLQTETRFSVGD